MSVDYWLGVLTLPALALAAFLAFVAYVRGTAALDTRWGISFSARWRRGADKISDYTLRHDIWWERSFGPVFVGGWYREPPRYKESSPRLFNRWIGLGRVEGPCLMVFRKRDLGEAPEC